MLFYVCKIKWHRLKSSAIFFRPCLYKPGDKGPVLTNEKNLSAMRLLVKPVRRVLKSILLSGVPKNFKTILMGTSIQKMF